MQKKVEENYLESIKNKIPKTLFSQIQYAISLGGKKLRPNLLYYSYKTVSKNNSKIKFEDAKTFALAIELLHNFTLIHDDIMDNAKIRRGKITLYEKFGTSSAILVGDTIVSLAYEKILETKNLDAIKIFTKSFLDVCCGQEMDRNFSLSKKNISLSKYFEMINLKTASLISASCEIGAIIACGTQNEIKSITNFGKNLGIAFQIQDDILDLYSNENVFGKKIGGDILEEKQTYLTVKTNELATLNEKKLLKKLFIEIKKTKSQKKIIEVKSIFDKLKIVKYAKLDIQNFMQKALNQIEPNKKKLLFNFSQSLLNRKF